MRVTTAARAVAERTNEGEMGIIDPKAHCKCGHYYEQHDVDNECSPPVCMVQNCKCERFEFPDLPNPGCGD